MTISYNWLCEYLPENSGTSLQGMVNNKIEPERLSKILTSIGLEVESMEKFEQVKGGLQGLVIGEVLEVSKHPNADKLSLTKVDIGSGEALQIVCGAPNVAAGQKVIVAPVGVTIHPVKGDALTMRVAKIRGVESFGMICAEDEIGMGESHAGIMVLPASARKGMPAAEYFHLYSDWIYEIGLTPNRMDAMSHLGVARDVCAYLTNHSKNNFTVRSPFIANFKSDKPGVTFTVSIENKDACRRYSGISINNVTIKESPDWLKQRLQSIGVRSINNIVDITNFILHETGQPLHAFDADKVGGSKIIVKNLPEGTEFLSLDEKKRILSAEDLMICDGDGKPMCIAGVFGGFNSGVSPKTKNIFLESAWFNPISIRKSSFRHNLRTDAATRFEKGVDISNTVNVLKRAALMIRELAEGEISGDMVDVYPSPEPKKQVGLKFHYLKKLSGKNYHPDKVKKILTSLGFELDKDGIDEIRVSVPYSKPDIELSADLVEEVMRIDGFDNVEIPQSITITPAVEAMAGETAFKNKVANFLVGAGFNEIFTNSITNSQYFSEEVLKSTVKMQNNLSAELNVMRPSMLETGLASIAHNLNHKNNNLRFFEFGKTYSTSGPGQYDEKIHLSVYVSGVMREDSWNSKAEPADLYFIKGVVAAILKTLGLKSLEAKRFNGNQLDNGISYGTSDKTLINFGKVSHSLLQKFDIKQNVFYADFAWEDLVSIATGQKLVYQEIPRFPAVQRDLAIILDKNIPYEKVENVVRKLQIPRLQSMKLFDVFESEKLGAGKKSVAVSFTFLDEERTMTDSEIDEMMKKILDGFESQLNAVIRK
ncbi:MAG: phenylalanine--tRNA ligase subunit beta [Bacteroidetes bacterium]|nr:MAG: phenylalanine--tRNA ligase subunit beta [Bacteroidota bacterium]